MSKQSRAEKVAAERNKQQHFERLAASKQAVAVVRAVAAAFEPNSLPPAVYNTAPTDEVFLAHATSPGRFMCPAVWHMSEAWRTAERRWAALLAYNEDSAAQQLPFSPENTPPNSLTAPLWPSYHYNSAYPPRGLGYRAGVPIVAWGPFLEVEQSGAFLGSGLKLGQALAFGNAVPQPGAPRFRKYGVITKMHTRTNPVETARTKTISFTLRYTKGPHDALTLAAKFRADNGAPRQMVTEFSDEVLLVKQLRTLGQIYGLDVVTVALDWLNMRGG